MGKLKCFQIPWPLVCYENRLGPRYCPIWATSGSDLGQFSPNIWTPTLPKRQCIKDCILYCYEMCSTQPFLNPLQPYQWGSVITWRKSYALDSWYHHFLSTKQIISFCISMYPRWKYEVSWCTGDGRSIHTNSICSRLIRPGRQVPSHIRRG